jgi:hypothetical protein
MTTRGMTESDVAAVVGFIDRGVQIALALQQSQPAAAKLKDFVDALKTQPDVPALRHEVEAWSRKFYMPG